MTRSPEHRPAIWLPAALFVLSVACAPERPLVERLDDGDWRPEPFRVVSMGGQRGGATISFALHLEAPSGRGLKVEGTVEINPQATLIGGSWSERGGSEARSGKLSATAVDFFGGQGGRPSLAGRFTLTADGSTVYRVNLPSTRLTSAR